MLASNGLLSRTKITTGGIYGIVTHVFGGKAGATIGLMYVLGQVSGAHFLLNLFLLCLYPHRHVSSIRSKYFLNIPPPPNTRRTYILNIPPASEGFHNNSLISACVLLEPLNHYCTVYSV